MIVRGCFFPSSRVPCLSYPVAATKSTKEQNIEGVTCQRGEKNRRIRHGGRENAYIRWREMNKWQAKEEG